MSLQLDRRGNSLQTATAKHRQELIWQYKCKLLESLITGKEGVGTIGIQVLTGGTISYDTGSCLYLPYVSCWVAEKELAKVLETSQDRVHRSLIRVHKSKGKPYYATLEAPEGLVSYRNVVFRGELYISCSRYLRALVKDLASRRPYLNNARVVYDTSTDDSYFGRQGVLK